MVWRCGFVCKMKDVEDVPGATALLWNLHFTSWLTVLLFIVLCFNSSLYELIKKRLTPSPDCWVSGKFGSEQADLEAFCACLWVGYSLQCLVFQFSTRMLGWVRTTRSQSFCVTRFVLSCLPPGHQPVGGAAAACEPGPCRVQQLGHFPAGRSPVRRGLTRGQAHLRQSHWPGWGPEGKSKLGFRSS